MEKFANKIVLVTGGSTGIGLTTALAFAEERATVVVAGRRVDEGERAVSTIQEQGGQASFIQTDITIEAEVAGLLRQIISRYGRLDIAFNNAGRVGAMGKVGELNAAE